MSKTTAPETPKTEEEVQDFQQYRDVKVSDVIQLRIDTSSPYFREVTHNQGIFVDKPLAVSLLCEVGKDNEIKRGGYCHMIPINGPNVRGTQFALLFNDKRIRLAKLNEIFLVEQILNFHSEDDERL